MYAGLNISNFWELNRVRFKKTRPCILHVYSIPVRVCTFSRWRAGGVVALGDRSSFIPAAYSNHPRPPTAEGMDPQVPLAQVPDRGQFRKRPEGETELVTWPLAGRSPFEPEAQFAASKVCWKAQALVMPCICE